MSRQEVIEAGLPDGHDAWVQSEVLQAGLPVVGGLGDRVGMETDGGEDAWISTRLGQCTLGRAKIVANAND